MSKIFFKELNIPEPDYNLEVGSGLHGFQTGLMIERIEKLLLKEKPDWVLVYGDTNSTIAGALAASKLHIPIAHVEAGLRSFNRKMPEEINRILTDQISDILCAPTQTAMENLKNEGQAKRSYFTGDVMYDSILFYKEKINNNPHKYVIPDLPNSYYLSTIHRAENTDNIKNLKSIFDAFSLIDKNVLLPIHPRTRKVLTNNVNIPKNVIIIDPVGYLPMLKLVMEADKILTESGGLQKESYLLRKQCVTLRNETEWIETLHDNWNILVGVDVNRILEALKLKLNSFNQNGKFGYGDASEKIVSIINT
jgi:UDP-N-acetylglucosamine 2-epimerase